MNWFILYYEALTKTGIFGLLLFLVTIIGIFSLCLPFLIDDGKWINKNIKKERSKIFLILSTVIILMFVFLKTYEKTSNDFSQIINQFKITYFLIGMLPFIITPAITLKYCKWFNEDYNEVK